ncbi:MAG: TetR/AcrR family transcriptional regulator [Thermoanaerobaculia bacterium]
MTRGPAKQFDRDEVLGRAMELFWAQGYEATGMSQLLEHMGIGRQSFYDTFGGKKVLFLEALGRYFEQRIKVAREVLEADGSPMGNVRRFFDTMIEMSERTGFCGCFMGNSLAEFGRKDPEMQVALGRFFGTVEQLFAETLARAQAAGEIPANAPVEDVARLLLVTSQGLALLSKMRPDAETAARLMDTSVAMMTGSYADLAGEDLSGAT